MAATTYIKDVNIISNGSTTSYLIEPALYGAASTNDSGSTYTVTMPSGFTLITGATIQVKFAATNAVNATLKVNTLEAKSIYYNNQQIAASTFKANHVYTLVYDGSKWQVVGDIDTNTQLSIGTGANQAAAGNHGHGNITNDGKMAGSTASGAVTTSHKFLREDGTWVIPSYTVNTWRGIQNNLTSSNNTTESLSAKQGYLLASGSARDNTKVLKSGDTMTGTLNLTPVSGEGGEIHLNASDAQTAQAGIVLDQQSSKFRIFGIASADGTSKTGTGTPLIIDPYAKTITGGYTLTGALDGNASTATSWANARKVYVALGTASKTTTINGGASNAAAIALGIDGTLGIGHGGTNATTAQSAIKNLFTDSTVTVASGDFTDNTVMITSDNNGSTANWYQRTGIKMWNYIKGKADSTYAGINVLAVANALVYKGVIAGAATGDNNAYGALTPAANCGDTYKVSVAGFINGLRVEVGDMLICTTDNTAAATDSGDTIYTTIRNNWNIIQTSEGSVSTSSTSSTDNAIARFDGTSGRIIQDSGITIDDNNILTIPQTTNGGYLYKNYTSASTTPAIVIGSNNQNVNLIRVYSSDGTYRDDKLYGFNLRYMGAGSGVNNELRFYADNQTGAETIAISMNQSGQVGIKNAANTSYSLYVNGATYINGATTINNNLDITAGTIYFGKSATNKAILAYNSNNTKFGIWYHEGDTDVMRFSASGNADNNTTADFAINALGAGILSNRNNYIPHTGNTTGSVGGTTTPVYVDEGQIKALSYTIAKSVPSNAVFTDHYAWSDITNKPTSIALTGAVTATATTLGSGAISITTTVNHGHGYLSSTGQITETHQIASGDRLIVTDSANATAADKNKLIATTITFDGSTATKALTQKGTWETFNNYSHPTGDGNLHVPANGTGNNGKFLQATATAGSYQWASVTKSTVGLNNVTNDKQLPIAGGTLTGAVTFANNTWNVVGDDVQIGDINEAGTLGIQGKNGNTAIRFTTYNQTTKTTGGKITWDGSKFSITSTTPIDASISGNAATATTASSVAWANVTGKPSNVTRTTDGFMSKEDKIKLDDMEIIKGTQTGKTGAWTGTSSVITSLYDGLTIKYYLNRDPSGNASLDLTLADGSTTGAIPCYYNSGRLTTHYAVGSVITLTYFSAGSIAVNGTATTDNRWIADANYDSGNTNTATRQKVRSTNANYSLLFADPVVGTADNNTAYYTYRNDSIYVNPSTGHVYATAFHGALTGNVTGNASSATKLANQGRATNANITHVKDGGMRLYLATGSMTSNKPANDGYILNFNWDTDSAWNSQIFISDTGSTMQYRGSSAAGTWIAWKTLLDSSNYTTYTVKKDGTGASGSWGISITGSASNITGTVAIEHGGTNATTAAGARTNLGLGSIATYNAATAGTKDTWGLVPVIGASDGVMEVGKYIDFHTTDGNTKDYDVRITAATTGLTISGTTSGTFSGSLTGNAGSASTVSAKLVTNKKIYFLGTETTITSTAANVSLEGDTGVYITTTAGEFSAVRHSYNVSGTEKAYTTYNSTDNSIDFIFL